MSDILNVMWGCVLAMLYLYGLWLFSLEVFCCLIPVTLFGALALFFAIHWYRIPAPDAAVVQDMLGLDPWTIEESKLTSDDSYFMKTCAHRFAGLDAPENSVVALRRAKERGCTAVEFDVALTSDGIPIVFHDADVNRVCDASGAVADMTWAELEKLDISAKHPLRDRFIGERIARLDQVVPLCVEYGLRMFIDLKGDDFRIIPSILEVFRANPVLFGRALVSSFNPALVYAIRRAEPRIAGSLAWRPYYYSYAAYSGATGAEGKRFGNPALHAIARLADVVHNWALDKVVYHLLGLSTILLHKDMLNAETALRWRKLGVRPIAFTVNLPSEKQYFRRVLKVTYMSDTLDSEAC